MTVALAFVWKDYGIPARFPALQQERALQSSACMVGYGTSVPDFSPQCYAAGGNTPAFALWGDSHSAALAPALRAEAASHNYRFVEFSKSSCLPLVGVAKYVPQHPSVVQECIRFNQVVLKTITADPSIHVVMLAGRWSDPFADGNAEPLLDVNFGQTHLSPPKSEESSLFVDALSKNIGALEAAGKHVVLIEDVPNFDFDPLCSLRTTYIPVRRMIAYWMAGDHYTPGIARASYADAVERSNLALDIIHGRFPNVELIDLRPMLCDGSGLCTYMHQGRLLYADGQHLTAYGAFYALRGVNLPDL